jgi:hypothetical protein
MDKIDEFYNSADIYAAMAAEDDAAEDDAEASKPLIGGGLINLHGRSVPVQVGDKTVDVPTMAYVGRLENIVREQKLALQKQERLLRALGQIIRQQKAASGHHVDTINAMRRELDHKIDRRD